MPKKILHLTFDMNIGGTEQVIYHLCNGLNADLFTCHIACLDGYIGPLGKKLQAENFAVTCFNRKAGLDFKLIKELRTYLKNHKIDIVHCHQYTPYIYGLFAATLLNIEVIFTEHGRFYPDSYKWKRFLLNPILSLKTKAITSISKATKEALITFENFPKEKIQVIYNGLAFSPREQTSSTVKNSLGVKESSLLFGTVARLDPIKNQTMMLEALSQLVKKGRECHLIIVGDGEMREELESLAQKLNLANNVTFTGFITEPQKYFQAIDVFLLTSFSEGTSMTILEAMANKKPCIVTDVGGNPELINNNISGLVIENDNTEELTAAMEKLISDKEMRVDFGNNAQEHFQKKFTNHAMCSQYSELYLA